MGKSSKVMTPRNVDLPLHVLKNNASSIALTGHLLDPHPCSTPVKNAKKPIHPRRKCLCLTLWIFLLLLLCGAVVVIANFLLPSFPKSAESLKDINELSSENNNNNSKKTYHVLYDENRNRSKYEHQCLERSDVTLAQKVDLADLIVTAKLNSHNSKRLKVRKILKGGNGNEFKLKSLKYLQKSELTNSACFLHEEDKTLNDEKIFFLSQYDNNSNNEWTPRFLAIAYTDKLSDVIESMAGESNQELQTPSIKTELDCPNCDFGGRCVTNDQSETLCSCDEICSNFNDDETVKTPVCGSDHVTYENACALQKAACVKQQEVTILSEKPCIDSDLCGIDGCPHFGICSFDGDEKRFRCKCPTCSVTASQEPVCGTDGEEYKSKCHIEQVSCEKQTDIAIKHYGACESCKNKICPSNKECQEDSGGNVKCVCKKCKEEENEQNSVKICGTDGITYFSLCHLELASCIQDQDIQPYHHGPCDPCKNVNCKFGGNCGNGKCICDERKCPDSYEPVCASNGKTFLNYCHLELNNCRQQQSDSFEVLDVVESDLCREKNPECLNKICECPSGVGGINCDRCLPKFWAFTSFGCRECGCNVMGSESLACDPQTGSCRCKSGFVGDKCNICPDGTLANITNCLRGSTRYSHPIPCGKTDCNFGASCSDEKQCLCEIDCRNPMYYREAVCGNDGNTYRSECQLRQYSCRLQKEVAITMFGPCKDAPTSIYGRNDGDYYPRDGINGVLADEEKIPSFGIIGDACASDNDCLSENTFCSIHFRCNCKEGYNLDKSSNSCRESLEGSESLCDPNPCHERGTCEEHDGVFSCYCQDGFAGTLCQYDLSKASTNQVASFTGKSFISVLTPDNAESRLEIRMNIRSFSDNGIVLFNQGNQETGDSDFLSIAVQDWHVEFRFDLGSGPVLLRSNGQLVPGQWHQIVAKRYHQDGLLEVDGALDRVRGSAKGSLKTLNAGDQIWIGGVEASSSSPIKKFTLEKIGTDRGFVGCIKDLDLSRKVVNLQSEKDPMIYKRENVVECEENPCVRLPCGENGICSVQGEGFSCTCKQDYTGRRCQRKRNECHPNPCQNNGNCKLDKQTSTFNCSCPDGFFGRLCEEKDEEDIWKRYRKSTEVAEKQKLSFGLITNLTSSELMELDIRLDGKDGLLKLSVSSKGEISLQILQGSQELLLSQETNLFLSTDSWHRLSMSYQNQKLTFNSDGQVTQLEGTWKNFAFQPGAPSIGNHANNRLCIRHFILRSRKGNRLEKTKPLDICK